MGVFPEKRQKNYHKKNILAGSYLETERALFINYMS